MEYANGVINYTFEDLVIMIIGILLIIIGLLLELEKD